MFQRPTFKSHFTFAACALLLSLACCHRPQPILDRPCEQDDQCGSGFDCYNRICTPVCTSQDQCTDDRTCYRHRCIQAPHANTTKAMPGAVNNSTPQAQAQATPNLPHAQAVSPANIPTPDIVSAELRAMRRELENIRRDQNAILELLKTSQGTAAQPSTTASASTVRPTQPVAKPTPR